MKPKTAHPFRRTAITSAVALVATMVAWTIPTFAGAQEEFIAGSGRARTQVVRVGPSAAQLSLAPAVGVALADYINTLGRGETVPVDYVALDGSINGSAPEAKEELPPLRVESTDENSEEGVRWEPKPGIVETAAATKSPIGRSAISLAQFEIPGALQVAGGRARAFSGVYTDPEGGGPIRVAGGTVDIGRVDLGGGAVVLSGLRWEGAQVTDENDDDSVEMLGGFTVADVVVNGESQGGPFTHEELAQVIEPMNEALAPLGLQIVTPAPRQNGSVVVVNPLAIRLASDILAPAGPGFQDVRAPITDGFIQACHEGEGGGEEGGEDGGEDGGTESDGGGGGLPMGSTGNLLGRIDPGTATHASHGGDHEEFNEFDSNGPDGRDGDPDYTPPGNEGGSDCGVPVLVVDLGVAPLMGGGFLRVDLGGVFGFTEGDEFAGFDFSFGDFGDFGTGAGTGEGGGFDVAGGGTPAATPSAGSGPVGDSGFDSTPPPSGGDDSGALPDTSPPSNGDEQLAAPAGLKGTPASAVWIVGLTGLALALAMAGADYQRLRGLRRAVTPIS